MGKEHSQLSLPGSCKDEAKECIWSVWYVEVTQKIVHDSMHKNLWNSHAESGKMFLSLSLYF